MSLFHHTIRKLFFPHDYHQIRTDIEYHIGMIQEELMVEGGLHNRLEEYVAHLKKAEKILGGCTSGGSLFTTSDEVRMAYEAELRKAHDLTLEIEYFLDKSKLPEAVKDKWIRLVKDGQPYLK